MRIPRLAGALLITSAVLVSGCMQTGVGSRMAWFRPAPEDDEFGDEEWLSENADMQDEEKDPWGFVGKEGRQDLNMEKDPDPPWLRNLLTSEKARAIERNVGIQ